MAGAAHRRPALRRGTLAVRIRFALLLTVTLIAGACMPTRPSPRRLVGTWDRGHAFVTDTLVLAPDGRFLQVLHVKKHEVWIARGRWWVERDLEMEAYHRQRMPDFLTGSYVVLDSAWDFHGSEDHFDWTTEARTEGRGKQALRTHWEWGRDVLEFNPDIMGFTRRSRVAHLDR